MLNGSRTDAAPRRRRFALLFDDLQSVHLFKDVGQIPFQMQRHFGYDAEIVCRRNEEKYLYLDDALQGLKVVFHDGHPYRHLLKHAREIDVLMLFHISTETIYRGLLYKVLNPSGLLYVKADMSGESIRYSRWGERNFITQTKRMLLFNRFVKRVDIVSFETERAYRGVSNLPQEKKLLLPNGFDPDFIDWYGVRRREFTEKENIILLVGRHGDYAKNTELMLDALEVLADIGDWQVWFVGPMSEEFEKRKDRFLDQFPRLADKVKFTGQIDDKRQLFELYSRAKVLCLTSRWEGFPNVAVEGLALGMIPMMPDSIACTADIIDHGRCGIGFRQDSKEGLSASLNGLLAMRDELEFMAQMAQQHFNRSFRWKYILKCLDERIKLQLNGISQE